MENKRLPIAQYEGIDMVRKTLVGPCNEQIGVCQRGPPPKAICRNGDVAPCCPMRGGSLRVVRNR